MMSSRFFLNNDFIQHNKKFNKKKLVMIMLDKDEGVFPRVFWFS